MGALNDLIDDFLASLDVEKGYSRNTLDAYARDLADFSAFLEEKGLADISRVDAESVSLFNQRLRSKGVSQNTVARKVACIRSFMKFAFRDSARGSQAVEDVERPRVRRGLPRALPENEVARVIDAMPADTPVRIRDRAMLELLYSSGMRASELTGARLSDLNWSEGHIRCVGKGSKSRVVPVGSKALQWLKRYLDEARPASTPANPTGCSSTRAELPSPAPHSGASWTKPPPEPTPQTTFRPTRSVTLSQPTSSNTEPTCAPFRKCSATSISPPPRFTPASHPPASEASTNNITPAPASTTPMNNLKHMF